MWRTQSHGSLSIKIHVLWSSKLKENSLKNTRPMYIVFVRFYFGDKSAVLKGRSRSRWSSKSTGISRKTEGEKHSGLKRPERLRVFRAYSIHVFFFGGSKVNL